jgi:SAM-dependent methyltransferase
MSAVLPRLSSTRSYEDQDGRIAAAITDVARASGAPIRILEAGCGRLWPIALPGVQYHLTGLDLDPAALDIRLRVEKDLDAVIHGDLCSVDLPPDSFDVVYSAYVLEHIATADVALLQMVRCLRPGGLLVIRIPDPDTARALVTKVTPFWFHVFYYRWVMKRPNAGKPGHAPYPTHYHAVISQSGMSAFAGNNRLVCIGRYADTFARDGKGLPGMMFRFGARIIDVLSLGSRTSRYNDVIYLFKKQPAAPA